MFFSSWTSLLRVVVVSAIAYAALILVLRTSGKRTLAKLNAFDLVVTVSLGSAFATVILSKSVALLEGVLAFAVLALLQFLVAWSALRFSVVRNVVKASPRALLIDGKVCEQALKDERVSIAEVLAAARSAGYGALADLAAVVLETDGSLSVIGASQAGDRSALVSLR